MSVTFPHRRKKTKMVRPGTFIKYFRFGGCCQLSYSLSGDGAFNFQTTNPVKKTQPKFARRPARRFLRLRPSLRQARGRFLTLLQGCPVDGQRAPRDGAPAPPPSDSTRQDWRVGSAHGRRLVLTETVGSATLEAAGSSTRGSGWGHSGLASFWERRAAQSRQARPEEAREPSWGTAKRGAMTMLLHRPAAPASGWRAACRWRRVSSAHPS